MRYKEIINTANIVKSIMESHIKDGYKALDCTVGNGKDTALLAQLVGDKGLVYGFDIQDIAIDSTRMLLDSLNLNHNVNLIKDSHENIDKYIHEKLDFIIYNLGYLPKGDKEIKTNKDSTIISLKKALHLLKNNGVMLITVYVGHDGGMEEKEAIEKLLSTLNQKQYNVLKYDFINQLNYPPVLYGIEKSL